MYDVLHQSTAHSRRHTSLQQRCKQDLKTKTTFLVLEESRDQDPKSRDYISGLQRTLVIHCTPFYSHSANSTKNWESVHITSNYPVGLPHWLIVTFFYPFFMRMLFKNNGCVSWHSFTYCISYSLYTYLRLYWHYSTAFCLFLIKIIMNEWMNAYVHYEMLRSETRSSADTEIARHASRRTQYWQPNSTGSERHFGHSR